MTADLASGMRAQTAQPVEALASRSVAQQFRIQELARERSAHFELKRGRILPKQYASLDEAVAAARKLKRSQADQPSFECRVLATGARQVWCSTEETAA